MIAILKMKTILHQIFESFNHLSKSMQKCNIKNIYLNYSKIFFSIVIILFLNKLLFGKIEPLKLLHAKTLNHISENDKSYLYLKDDVQFKKGNIKIFSDEAYHYKDEKYLTLNGNVIIIDSTTTIKCDFVKYYTETDKIEVPKKIKINYNKRELNSDRASADLENEIYYANGNVVIKDSSLIIRADSAIYYNIKEITNLYNNASIIDTVEHNEFFGDFIKYYMRKDEFVNYIDPEFIKKDSTGKELLRINAEKISGNTKKKYFTAIENVKIFKDSLKAKCDSLFFSDSLEIALLNGKPEISYKENIISGKKIDITFHDSKTDEVIVNENATMKSTKRGFLVNNRDTVIENTSNLTGRKLILKFKNKNNLDWLRMEGMASSDYHVYEDSVYQGINKASGDTVKMFFDGDSLTDIFVINGAEGTFYPHGSIGDMDTSLVYNSDIIYYDRINQKTTLYQNSNMIYGEMSLAADTIKVDWRKNILYALPQKTDSGLTNIPTMQQKGDDPLKGEYLAYNMDTKRGKILQGKTNIEDGYYYGSKIMKREDKPFYIKDGKYTTCDAEKPHYWIESKMMKLVPKDKVYAKPLILKIYGVPVFYFPVGIFPIHSGGRQSGWIIPSYGESSVRGSFLEHGGYYWAPNDYFDSRLLGNFYDKKGVEFNFRNRYKLRYYLSGNLNVRYWNDFIPDTKTTGYRIDLTHNQTFGKYSRLNINGSYTSDNTRYKEETLQQDRLNQNIVSNATFSTRLGPFGMNANAYRKVDLLSGNVVEKFPQISISKNTAPLFKKKNILQPNKWYHNIRYNISGNLNNVYTSTLQSDSTFLKETKNMAKFQSNINFIHKFFGWLNISPSVNYNEGWIIKYDKPVMQNDSILVDSIGNIITEEVNEFKRRGTYSGRLSASTKVYGIFPVKINKLEAIRHIVSTSLSYGYTPDFAKNENYIYKGIGTNGEELEYDYFKNTMIGNTPTGKSENLSMSFNHTFEMKIKQKDGSYKKFHFLSLSHNYDFLKDSLNFSNISARTNISKLPGGNSLSINATFDPYVFRTDSTGVNGNRINELTIPRMTRLSLNTGFNISEGKRAKDDSTKYSDDRFSKWSIRAGLSYTHSATNPNITNDIFSTSLAFKANLSEKWSVSYNARFDILNQKLIYHNISLRRDMHCWELSFDWTPSGYNSRYFLKINVKSPNLQDLKYEKKKRFGY